MVAISIRGILQTLIKSSNNTSSKNTQTVGWTLFDFRMFWKNSTTKNLQSRNERTRTLFQNMFICSFREQEQNENKKDFVHRERKRNKNKKLARICNTRTCNVNSSILNKRNISSINIFLFMLLH